MNGPQHRTAAVAAWLVTAPHLGVTPGQLAFGAVIAGACGHGRLSPDADLDGLSARIIPGGHHGITHWPVTTACIWLASLAAGGYAWQVWAVAVAWTSHVAADAVFGTIPIIPHGGGHWTRIGLGVHTGSPAEMWIARPAFWIIAIWFTGSDVVQALAHAWH